MQEITIFDEIQPTWGYNKRYLKYELDAAQGADVSILISSPGGDVAEGMAIADMLERYSGTVETTGIGVVASIATIALMAGDKVKMTKNSFLMIHRPWSLAVGTADELRNTADTLEKMDDLLVGYYVDKMKKRNKAEGNASLRVKRMMEAETWLTAQQALDMGFIDEIADGGQYEDQINIIPMQNRLSQYRHTPAALINQKNENMSFFKSIKAMLGGEEQAPKASADAPDLAAARKALEDAGFTITEATQATEEEAAVTVGDVTESMEFMAKELAELKAQLKNTVGAPSGSGESDGKAAKGQPSKAEKAFHSKLTPLVELLKQN